MVKVLSKCQSSGPLEVSFVTLDGSTKHQGLAVGVWGCGAASQPGCGMFSYSSFEKTVLSRFMSVFSVRNK